MTRTQIQGGVIASVIVWGTLALVVITGGWFGVAVVIAFLVAGVFLFGAQR